ncbi:MAG: hypothetical protein HYW49_08725 [Deltaproteobacteria bacterium]|nr:hypothetical protein [Deltaproteobacteria bacterium]
MKGQYISAIDSEIEKETAKKKSLDGKTEKFGQTMQEIEQVLGISGGGGKDSSGSSKIISQFKIGVAEHKLKLQQFEQMKVKTRSNRALMCVKSDPLPPFSQIRNCYQPTIYQCMVENYFRERQLYYSGGSTRVSPADKRKAEIDKARFEGTVSKLFGDFSSGEKSTPAFSTYDSLMSRYGPRLEAFGDSGKMLRSELARCYNNAGEQMAKELADPTSELYNFGFEAKKNGEKLSADMGDVINKLDKSIRDAGSAVFQSELNELVNGHGCNTRAVMNATAGKVTFQTQALETQLECAQGLNENLYALLNGTPPPGSTQPILATLGKGADGKEQFCKGLRDCFDKSKKLASASESRISQLKGKSTFADTACTGGQCPGREKAISDSNRNIQTAFQQGADAFKSRVAGAKAMLDQVKQMFSKAGIEFPTIDETKPRPFSCKGENEICALPDPFDDAMAAAAGLPLMKSGDFAAASRAAKAEMDNEKKDYEKAKGNLEAMADKCKKQIKEEEKERKQTLLNKKQQELNRKLKACQQSNEKALSGAASDIDAKVKPLRDEIAQLKLMQLNPPANQTAESIQREIDRKNALIKSEFDMMVVDVKDVSGPLKNLIDDYEKICAGDENCSGTQIDLSDSVTSCENLSDVNLAGKGFDPEVVKKVYEKAAKTVR